MPVVLVGGGAVDDKVGEDDERDAPPTGNIRKQ